MKKIFVKTYLNIVLKDNFPLEACKINPLLQTAKSLDAMITQYKPKPYFNLVSQ